MNSNQLFKELRGVKKAKHETHEAIEKHLYEQKGERTTELSEDEAGVTPGKTGSLDQNVSDKQIFSTAYKAKLDKDMRQRKCNDVANQLLSELRDLGFDMSEFT